ncbi:MAG: ATP-binding protein [Acidimicrobiia bacterium]
MIARPSILFDRDREWADLVSFVDHPTPRLRLGVVHGRRRFGKSFLLRRLTETLGGCYHLAFEESARPALDRFAVTVGRLYEPVASLGFEDWDQGLRSAVDLLGHRGSPQVLVIDEYPYLRAQSRELDSVIQSLIDAATDGAVGEGWTNPVSIILCGSALSVMTELLSGTAAMRGRASLDLSLEAFDYRQAREYWGIAEPATAFGVHSVIGGAAGYRDLTAAVPNPERLDDLGDWVAQTVFNPSHALFREDEYLLREDPRITKEAVYYSIMGAVAAGKSSQSGIAAAIGKKAEEVTYHLNVLVSAGFVTRQEDLLVARNPSYRVADPIVRFHQLITRRHQALLEDRRAAGVWNIARDTHRSKVVGPHFEGICRAWTARYASGTTLGGDIGPVGTIQVNDPDTSQSFELHVATATASTSNRKHKTLQVIGEAKGSARPCGIADLDRLDRIRALLAGRAGVTIAEGAKLLVFGFAGFDDELQTAAAARPDVELVDLDRLYDGD